MYFNLGKYYNGNGSFLQWWSPTTEKGFQETRSCVADYFNTLKLGPLPLPDGPSEEVGTHILYTALIWSAKISLYIPARSEGICATLNSHIQVLKLFIHYYIDIYLKDVILTLSREAQKMRKSNACENTSYTVIYTTLILRGKLSRTAKFKAVDEANHLWLGLDFIIQIISI